MSKRKLPRWMAKLQCNERFVNQPPSLKSICSAKILTDKLIKTEEDEYIFKVMGSALVKILCTDYTIDDDSLDFSLYPRGFMWHYLNANCVPDFIKRNIIHVWGYSTYDIVEKSLVNNVTELEIKAIKRQKFLERVYLEKYPSVRRRLFPD